VNTLTRREITALVVAECKGRPDDLRRILESYSLKIACVMRPPNPDREGSTGGGVSVVVRRDTTLKTRAAHPLGGLWVSVEPKGANPFNLLAFYMPTTSSTLVKRQPLARQMLLEWADICINQIEGSPTPTWVAAGDFNVSIGCPQGMGRRSVIKARPRENRERKLLIAWLNRHNLIPAHGTLEDDVEAEHTSTGGANTGQGEPDYIFVKRGSTYKTVRTDHELLPPTFARHRLRTCLVTIPPPLQKQQRPIKEKGIKYIIPQYGDKQAWNAHAEKTATWMREKAPILLDPDTTPTAMLETLTSCITGTAEECFAKVPVQSKHNVLRLYQGRDIPAKAAKHFATRRRLRHEASNLAKAGDAEGARRKYLQAQLQRSLGIKVAESTYRARLGQATSNLYKRDASGFFNVLKAGARVDASPDGHEIPNAPDGSSPATTFPNKAGELFAKSSSPPPAISTEKDRWSPFIPRPQPLSTVADPPDPARKATVSELFQLMFGPCKEYPPVHCCKACIECKKRSAQYTASKEGRANRVSAALKGSKAAGEDGIQAELLGWMRDAKIDDPDGVGTRTTLATIMCDFFNKMLETGEVPEGFTHAKILPLLKPGKAGEVPAAWAFGSYRLLALRKLFDKVVKLLINSRLLHHVLIHGITGDSQTGFMPNLSTEDAIFVMSHILQRVGDKEHPLYNLYFDIVRAYDNVDHEALCYVLETVGVPPKLVHLLRVMMQESFGTLYLNGTSSAPIRLGKGVPQGDPLSCLLFAIFIASLPRYLSSIPELVGVDCVGTLVLIMLYADDGASPCVSKEQAELMLKHCNLWARAWQLELNTGIGKTMYTAHNGGNFTDVTGSPIRGPEDLGLVEMAQGMYRYLGAAFSNVLNWDAISSEYTQKVWGAYMGLRHRSSIVRNLSIAQQLQLMKVFLAPYLQAFSPVSRISQSLVMAERRRLEAISNILRLPVNASHLLLYSLSGCPTEMAHRLRERLRLFYHFSSHPALKQDPVVCMPKSVSVFRGLLRVSFECRKAGNAPPPKYNWVHETIAALTPYQHFTPVADGTIRIPDWPFFVPHIIKNFETAVSYTLVKEASIPKWTRPTGIGDDEPWPCVLGEPVSNGGHKHAGFLTAWLTAPDWEFTNPDGPGMGCLGPGLRHPLALASHNNRKYVALVRAQQGCAALRRWPWIPDTGDDGLDMDESGNPLTINMGAVDPLPANWNEYTRCPLCGHAEDSIYHVVSECPHPRMLEVRTLFWSSTVSHVRHLRSALVEARRAALDRPADLELLAEDKRALYMADKYFLGDHPAEVQGPGISDRERRIYSYRLLLAAPWAARNADHEHHMARALGKHFDGIKARTAPNNLVRGLASSMCSWGERWIIHFARSRLKAIGALAPAIPPMGPGNTS